MTLNAKICFLLTDERFKTVGLNLRVPRAVQFVHNMGLFRKGVVDQAADRGEREVKDEWEGFGRGVSQGQLLSGPHSSSVRGALVGISC